MDGQLFFVKNVKNKNVYIRLKVLILIFLSFQVIAEEFVYGLGDVPIFKDMKSIEDSYITF